MKRGVQVGHGHEGGDPHARDPRARGSHDSHDSHARDPRPPEEEADGPAAAPDPDAVAYTVGGLLIELGEKIRRAGTEGVRILTDDEVQRDQLAWFRAGWTEHARATSPDRSDGDRPDGPEPSNGPGQHPDSEGFPVPPARLLRFPERQPEDHDHQDERRSRYTEGPQEHHKTEELRLPVVGAGESRIRDLMPHRPRSRRLREGEDEDNGDTPRDRP
ncbi:hypothetical protein [Streptomyces olivochromogenes]|uniref:hypothetical protein n=1 Tax=Streptomyces olivochromogenes TaxID=1963 RepID=UPI0036BC5667